MRFINPTPVLTGGAPVWVTTIFLIEKNVFLTLLPNKKTVFEKMDKATKPAEAAANACLMLCKISLDKAAPAPPLKNTWRRACVMYVPAFYLLRDQEQCNPGLVELVIVF